MNGVSTFMASSNFLPFFNFSKTLNEFFLNTDEAGLIINCKAAPSPSASIFDKLLKIGKKVSICASSNVLIGNTTLFFCFKNNPEENPWLLKIL